LTRWRTECPTRGIVPGRKGLGIRWSSLKVSGACDGILGLGRVIATHRRCLRLVLEVTQVGSLCEPATSEANTEEKCGDEDDCV
jgi:hypothetical protein